MILTHSCGFPPMLGVTRLYAHFRIEFFFISLLCLFYNLLLEKAGPDAESVRYFSLSTLGIKELVGQLLGRLC